MHWWAFRRYHGKLSRQFDVVVDEVNTIPFFTPLWADVPVVMLIHQLAREVWWHETGFPLNALGFVCEPLYLSLYRRVPVLTVSASTKEDLVQLGFKGSITVVPQGLESVTEVRTARPAYPTFLYVGRLAPSKRVSDVIRAFAAFSKSIQATELRLLGEGPAGYVQRLHSLVDELGLEERVRFLGRASTHEKHQEMAAAHMLLLASVREGWGLVVTEANAFGTPAVGYDVHGLRDSIRDHETGLLVDPTPKKLADAMMLLWRDPDLYQRMSAAARAWSATFSFERTATAFRAGIAAALAKPPARRQDGLEVGN